jgi:DNA-binding response OmpR family regulator
MKIAVVDDDNDITSLISLWLEEAGHECFAYQDGKTFLKEFGNKHIDVILLDMMMPEVSGEKVLEELRVKNGLDIPVIFVTSITSEEDMVRILNEGADDYIVKPVSKNALIARINAVSRRTYKGNDTDIMQMGAFSIDRNRRTVTYLDEPIKLTDKEYELVLYIFNNVGRLMPRQQILSSVWGYETEVNTRTVDTHMSRIRKKLNLAPEHGWRLSSIYHQGYRLEQL